MPLYDYECRACEARFEHLAPNAEANSAACPRCGAHDARKLLSVIAGMGGRAEAPAPRCGEGACGNCS